MANNYGYMAKVYLSVDDSGIAKDLKEVDAELRSVGSQVKTVQKAITSADKSGVDSTELQRTAYELLGKEVEAAAYKLERLQSVEESASSAFINGDMDTGQWAQYNADLTNAEVSLKSLEATYAALGQRLGVVSEAEATEEAAMNSTSSAIDGYNQSLNEHRGRLADINSSIAQNNEGYKDLSSSITLSGQKQRELAAIQSELQEKLAALKAEAADMKEAVRLGEAPKTDYEDLQREIINTKSELSNLKNETGEYSDAAKNGGENTQTFGDMLKANLTSDAIISGVKALAQAIGDIVSDIKELVNETMESGDTIDKQSQILGLSREAYQEWDYVLNLNGASISNMTTATRSLTNAVEEAESGSGDAAEAFEKLGLSMDDVSNMSREDLFEQVIYGLQGMTDEQERNAAANDLLGRSYTQLIPLLNQSAESTQELMQTAHENGMIMSDESVDAAVAYKDALTTLNYTLDGVKNNLMAEIMPGLEEIVGGFSDLVAGSEDGAERIVEGFGLAADSIEDILNNVSDIVGDVIETAFDKIPEIISGSGDKIKNTMTTVVSGIVDGITEHMDDIFQVGGEIIGGIINGIGDSVVLLLEKGPELVSSLAGALIDAIPDVANFAVEFCDNIAYEMVHYDWASTAEKVTANIMDKFDSVFRKSELLIDRIFYGNQLFGGDIAKTDSFWESLGVDKDKVVDDIAKTVDDVTTSIQEAYDKGMDSLTNGEYSYLDEQKRLEENAQAVLDKYSGQAAEWKAAKDGTADTTEQAAELLSETNDALEESVDELETVMDGLDHLLATHKISEEDYWAQRLEMLNKYRDEDSEQWWKWYDETTEYYADLEEARQKAAQEEIDNRKKEQEEREKQQQEEIEAQEKAAQEKIEAAQKEAEEYAQAVENAKSSYLKTGSSLTSTAETDSGERLVLNDLNAETEKLQRYRDSMDALKNAGASDEFLQNVLQFDYSDGSRQAYIDEILKLSDEKRQLYFDDFQEYMAAAGETGAYEVGLGLDDTAAAVTDGIMSVYNDAAKQAYDSGTETALQYLQGISDTFGGSSINPGDILGTAGIGTFATTAAKSEIIGNVYSGETVITIKSADGAVLYTDNLNNIMKFAKMTGVSQING